MDMDQQTVFEIDLLGLFRYLKRKLRIIALVTVLCAVMSFLVSCFVLPREYIASTRVYVLSRSVSDGLDSYDFAMSNYMISDLEVLITGRNVTESVIDKLNLDMTHEALSRKIVVSAEGNTRVLQISATDCDAQMAADIANAVRDVASEQLKSIMDLEAVNLVYEAKAPQEPTSPNVVKNTLCVAGTALILAVCILSSAFFLNDSINRKEDMEKQEQGNDSFQKVKV